MAEKEKRKGSKKAFWKPTEINFPAGQDQNSCQGFTKSRLLGLIKVSACPYCQYRCYKTSDVKRHIMFKHTGEKPFKCDVCQKRFTLKQQLQNHIRTHTGERPFQCSICLRRFNCKSNLSVHIKNIHKNKS